jgi:hypothetical protein
MLIIDPSIMLAAMATVHKAPSVPARVLARARRIQFAPLTPPAISVSRAA